MPISSFQGKTAAITGAGSGMGRSLALALTARGCDVAISDINEQNLQETAELVTQQQPARRVSSHPLDVSNRDAVESFAADVANEHGRVNLIFNNAGVSVTDDVEHMSFDDFEWLMNINFWGVVYGSKAFLPLLRQQNEAQIVNTSSIFGTIALPSQAAYNASKFAVRGFTYALRQELADTTIGVSCVQPGGVKTNIVRDSRYRPRDNSAPTRDEIVGRFEEMAGLTADQAAEQILRGVLANRAQILVGRDAKLIALVERIIPISYQKLLGRLFDNDGDKGD